MRRGTVCANARTYGTAGAAGGQPPAATQTFQTRQTFTAGTNPGDVVVTDLNRDGRPDLLVTNLTSNNVSVLLANSDGSVAGQAYTVVGPGVVVGTSGIDTFTLTQDWTTRT